MPIVALDDCSTSRLISTHNVTPVFRVELRGQLGGIDQVAEHDRQLPSFRVGRRRGSNARCDLSGWLFLHSRLWCWLSRGSGDFLSACSFTRPDHTSTLLIDHRVREEQLVFQVVEVVVIEVKASLEGTIGCPSLAFEEVNDL